ncbi:hypothetical protein MBLNU230_g6249t1 [Neophaeotheca triangularis]
MAASLRLLAFDILALRDSTDNSDIAHLISIIRHSQAPEVLPPRNRIEVRNDCVSEAGSEVQDGRQLWVAGIGSATKPQLSALFDPFGTVEKININPRGFAFITMDSNAAADAAVKKLGVRGRGDSSITVKKARKQARSRKKPRENAPVEPKVTISSARPIWVDESAAATPTTDTSNEQPSKSNEKAKAIIDWMQRQPNGESSSLLAKNVIPASIAGLSHSPQPSNTSLFQEMFGLSRTADGLATPAINVTKDQLDLFESIHAPAVTADQLQPGDRETLEVMKPAERVEYLKLLAASIEQEKLIEAERKRDASFHQAVNETQWGYTCSTNKPIPTETSIADYIQDWAAGQSKLSTHAPSTPATAGQFTPTNASRAPSQASTSNGAPSEAGNRSASTSKHASNTRESSWRREWERDQVQQM